MNKKKLELFNETLKLGALNEKTKIGNKTALLLDQNKDMKNSVTMSHEIIK